MLVSTRSINTHSVSPHSIGPHSNGKSAIEPPDNGLNSALNSDLNLRDALQIDLPKTRIHPTADVSNLAEIGAGTQIWNNSQVRENARIGRRCNLGKDVYIDFSVQIGDNVKIQNGVSVYHGTSIDSNVFVGPGVIFTNDKRPRATTPDGRPKGNDDWEVGHILICYGASIGAGAIILPDVSVGRYAMVGAGAVVTCDVADYAVVVGTPARQIGYACECGSTLAAKTTVIYACPTCGENFYFVEEIDGRKS